MPRGLITRAKLWKPSSWFQRAVTLNKWDGDEHRRLQEDRRTGEEDRVLKYMMAETVVYAREYLFMKELLDAGRLGKLQFMQASHQQDMDGWPNYWPGLPPMWYATHCVGPVAGLIGKLRRTLRS